MKVTTNKTEVFNPIQLHITIETVDEARAMYAIFNKTDNTCLLPKDMQTEIKDKIGKDYYVSRSQDIIANDITYRQFYYPKD